MKEKKTVIVGLQSLQTNQDNYFEHQFHTSYDCRCSECYRRGELVGKMFDKTPIQIIKFNK